MKTRHLKTETEPNKKRNLMQTNRSSLTSLIYMALFAALMATTALFSLYVATIPFTLQTLYVVLAALILTPREAAGSMAFYVFLGVVGLPVFAGGQAGLSALLGPTGGFIIGFIFAAFFASLAFNKLQKKTGEPSKGLAQFAPYILASFIAILVVYVFGATWFMYSAAMPFWPALLATVIPFIIPDVIKAAVATLLAMSLKRIMK